MASDSLRSRHDATAGVDAVQARTRSDGSGVRPRWSTQPLPWLLLLALALRLWAALTPGFHHPDAIYQYLEPAHRLLTGEGVVTWEWRVGMRSWLLPALLAVPLGIGEALDPDGMLPMILPRVATAIASLGIIWAAYDIGRRRDATTGALAGFAAAIWFEIVFFAAETLAEPIAVSAFLPAAALVTAPAPTARRTALAGALLALAALARPHYAPAAAALVLISWRSDLFDWRRWAALVAGALIVAAACAAIDARQGLVPFAWIGENVRQNVVHNVAARYGILPPLAYVAWLIELWGWWLVPLAIGVQCGWRRCPGLLAAAAVTLVLHSLIPHKEYRFVVLAFAAIVLLAAIGWGEIVARVRARWGATAGRRTAMLVFATWAAASIALAQGPLAPNRPTLNTDGWNVFAHLRADPAVCGVALIQPASFANVPGAVGLRRGVPLSMFWTGDPASRADPWTTARLHGAGFNRMVTIAPVAARLPAGYRIDHCERQWQVRVCVLARAGTCAGAAASPYLINRVMARTGF